MVSPSTDTFVAALIEGDREACERISQQVLSDTEPLRLYLELFQPALYRIGDLWACSQISVAVEHRATAITEWLMNQVYPRFINPQRTGRRVILATVEEELHQVGVKMVADLFEHHGWDTHLPGAGCPTLQLLAVIDDLRPDALGLSCSVAWHFDTLQQMLRQLRDVWPDLPILIGGQALSQISDAALEGQDHTLWVSNLDQLEHWIIEQTANPREDSG